MITVVWLLVWCCLAVIATPYVARFLTRDTEALDALSDIALVALVVLAAVLLGVASTGTAPIA